MSNNQTQQQAQAPQTNAAQSIGIGAVWGMACNTAYNSLGMVDALASTGHHLARTAEERAAGFREEQKIASAIKHNQMMHAYEQQAQELGITI